MKRSAASSPTSRTLGTESASICSLMATIDSLGARGVSAQTRDVYNRIRDFVPRPLQ